MRQLHAELTVQANGEAVASQAWRLVTTTQTEECSIKYYILLFALLYLIALNSRPIYPPPPPAPCPFDDLRLKTEPT